MEISRAPEPTANLSSDGDHRTHVAARLIRRRTKVGFQPEGDGSHTYAFLSRVYLSTPSLGTLPQSPPFPTLPRKGRTLGASHNTTSTRSNVYAGDRLIMPLQFILQCELAAGTFVELNMIVSGHGQCLSISGKGMICDWMMEKVMSLGRRHILFDETAIGVALYYCMKPNDEASPQQGRNEKQVRVSLWRVSVALQRR